MPNWCHNELTVSGSPEAVRSFMEKVQTDDQPLTFQAHVPEPTAEEYLSMAAPCKWCEGTGKTTVAVATAYPAYRDAIGQECRQCGGSGKEPDGWYDWRVRHWGTKWDANFEGPFMALGAETADVDKTVAAQGVSGITGFIVYKFTTAWSPPAEWLRATAEQEPQLTFTLRYGEPGNNFAGELKFSGGEEEHDLALSVEEVLTPDEMWY